MDSNAIAKSSRVYVAGHKGLVGSAIVRRLEIAGYKNILTISHSQLDLMNKYAVDKFFSVERPEYVFMSAAKVGGIKANLEAQDQFLYINTMIEFNTIMAAFNSGVKKFCLLGSGCIYPRDCPQPIKEEYLLTSPLEATNEGYALAKISGLKLCQYLNDHYPQKTDFISAMPCNLYGPGDNFHPEYSHVIPALISKFHKAIEEGKEIVEIWGTGNAMREFMHIDDMADALYFLMCHYSGKSTDGQNKSGMSWINIGSGIELKIRELADIIARITEYKGKVTYNESYPDGTPRKLLDSTKLFNLGWKPSIAFEIGLRDTYKDYIINKDNYRK